MAGLKLVQDGEVALLFRDGKTHAFPGRWIVGSPWERFGKYDRYVVVPASGALSTFAAHAGELVPGSTEDLVSYLRDQWQRWDRPSGPLTLELDPTYSCASRDCGGRCFSAAYRRLQPNAKIERDDLVQIIGAFAKNGGKVLRFDGGGDPLLHSAVRDGSLPLLAQSLQLKTTLLTSGDLLPATDLRALAASSCYVRISLNAATDATRMRFHGNSIPLVSIMSAIERLALEFNAQREETPIGATFLLDESNFHEVLTCAHMCRAAGVAHFSVRRVLGPESLRPSFSPSAVNKIGELLHEVSELGSDSFRVFVPWRPVDEADLAPRKGDIPADRCWQSTFKTVVEPSSSAGGFRVQLCGRYRGGGVGQAMQMPELAPGAIASTWVDDWRASFTTFPLTREKLVSHCSSCIDRGFITMVTQLVRALEGKEQDFEIFHLKSAPT